MFNMYPILLSHELICQVCQDGNHTASACRNVTRTDLTEGIRGRKEAGDRKSNVSRIR